MNTERNERKRRNNPQPNEGEGNKTAARAYNQAQREFVEDEDWKKKARKAAQSLDRKDEAGELIQAEEKARAKAGPDPNR